MPNYCSNTLVIYGCREELSVFAAKARAPNNNDDNDAQSELKFSNFVPTPLASYDELERPITGELPFWYRFRVENWGTKWEPMDVTTLRTTNRLVYRFGTAWSPPEAWVDTVSKLFPKLSFYLYYNEPGMELRGMVCWKRGEKVGET